MKTVELEILTPKDMFFKGEIESLSVDLITGNEGYLPNHVWVRKLLKDDGYCEFREAGETQNKKVHLKGGFVEIRDVFTVFTEDAEYVEK